MNSVMELHFFSRGNFESPITVEVYTQGLRFPGGLPQINVKPDSVINQSTKLVN